MSRYHRVGSVLLALVFLVSVGTVAAQQLASFSDIEGHWAQAAIERLAAQGVVGGYPDGTFRPDNPLTRAEAVTIIDRFLTPLTTRLDRLEAQTADRAPALVIDDGLAVKFEEVSHSVDEERLAVAVKGFVRNTSAEIMAFNPSQVVLIMQNEAGESLGTIQPTERTEALRLEPGEGRQVMAAFVIEGEQLVHDQLASLAVGVVDSQGQVQAVGIVIGVECSWPPLRCRLIIKIEIF